MSTTALVKNTPSDVTDQNRTHKRRRTSSSDQTPAKKAIIDSEDDDNYSPQAAEKRHRSHGFMGIQPPSLIYPKSLYAGHTPPLPRSKERLVLKDVLESEENCSVFEADDFISVTLDGFSIYRPHQTRARQKSQICNLTTVEKTKSNELVSLHELQDRGSSAFLLDGVISYGTSYQHKRYVQGVPFETLSIGSYENTTSYTVGSDIWVQSIAGKGSNVWYRLNRPAIEYQRYHDPFLWLADLAKHLVDFLHTHQQVTLRDFEHNFITWLRQSHQANSGFLAWQDKYGKSDFRQPVAVYATFLYNQAGQLHSDYASHPLWGEIDPAALTAVPPQPAVCRRLQTVVTPYVYQCFSQMPWAKHMSSIPFDPTTTTTTTQIHQRLDGANQILQSLHARTTKTEGHVGVGDVVAIRSDTNTRWKTKDEFWYAYVQDRKMTKCGQRLGLIWLYRPADTACQAMKYPYPNELFMSDHCNCGDGAIYATDVARKVRVRLFDQPSSTDPSETDFFIRQKYTGINTQWTTLKPSDFQCSCAKADTAALKQEYNIGDTLLVKATSLKEILEPVVLLAYAPEGDSAKVLVRRLLRKQEDYGDIAAEPNELVYTFRDGVCNIDAIVRRCHIRFYTREDRQHTSIPAPYNRKGTADCFFASWQEMQDGRLEPLLPPWPLMNQGFNPLAPATVAPLRGLDIFCGGGNLGRGLEEFLAVRQDWAVDYFTEAIHTYLANDNHGTKLYNGSVNDYLYQAIHQQGIGFIAQKGEVDCICAGCPCQGLSMANLHYTNEQSQINTSMIASVVSYINFHRPKYFIMENVLGMASGGPKRGGQETNLFAQVLCALVGMGYQVKPMILDAWNFGAPQSRTRLFITGSAPGLSTIEKPPLSHSHPDSVVGRSLGKTANGLPFSAREWSATPFDWVSIGEATADLPVNSDGRTSCIAYPNHRVSISLSVVDQVRLSCVPRFPSGMNFIKSANLGLQPPPQMAAWHWDSAFRSRNDSHAWQRSRPDALRPTVTTFCSPSEAIGGSSLHWEAHRPHTVMEAARAQGNPDEEILIGAPAMQWKVIGNGVPRQISIALGSSLREAHLADAPEYNPQVVLEDIPTNENDSEQVSQNGMSEAARYSDKKRQVRSIEERLSSLAMAEG
ncbi:MAG: hypothetical protein Q9222_001602 [Ikaeria aurantiellina]